MYRNKDANNSQKKISFASPLNNEEWITFHKCKKNFCTLFQRESFSALR